MGENEDRRNLPRGGDDDHDILIEIRADLKNFLRRFNQHEQDETDRFNVHVQDQANTFEVMFSKVSGIQKFQWLLAGGFVVANLFLIMFGKEIVQALK